jgi:hypothetical protein
MTVNVTGGDKLKDFFKKLKNKSVTLKVGFLNEKEATVAAANEYGDPSKNRPPRPFMQRTITKNKGKWSAQFAAIAKQNDYDITKSVGTMGELIKGQIKDTITAGGFAELKQATIDRKGFSNQLVDTGSMRDSVDYEIVEK